jgi:surface carbohydrate biosynthesis protein
MGTGTEIISVKLRQLFYHFLKLFGSSSQIRFALPPQADVVIYDEVGSQDLARILLQGLNYRIHHVRGENYNLHPLILWRAAFYFLFQNATARQAYDLACLTVRRPKLAITYIDNSPNLAFLSRKLNCPFLIVQNGFRTHHCAQNIQGLPNLYCFGRRDIDLFSERGIDVSGFSPVGSIKSSYFLETLAPKINGIEKYDICLISSYQIGMEHKGFAEPRDYRQGLVEGTRKTCEYLAQLQREKALKIVICGWMKAAENAGEIAFFRQYFDESTPIVAAEQEYLNSYRLTYQSKLTVSYCSTLGFEALSWGKKVFFFHMPYEKNYRIDHPHSDFFRISKGDFTEFSKKVSDLLLMPKERYAQEVQRDLEYVMVHRPQPPAHQIIREKILSFL